MTDSVEQGRADVHASTPGRPRPRLAAVLSFLVPGLGHQYGGFYRRAAWLLVLFPAAETMVLPLIVLLPVRVVNVVVPVALVLVLRAVVSAWAARDSRSGDGGTARGRLSRWYGLVATVVLMGAVVNPVWGYAYRTTLVQAYRFPTGSMEPTILMGDYVVAANWAYGWHLPLVRGVVLGERPAGRGDLVVFPYPEDPSRSFLKRVIGLPGETVEIRARQVFIDGRPLDEPYARFIEAPGASEDLRDGWGPETVPPGSYFVLGDNRDNSRDSRFWGFVAQRGLLGRARVVYWSKEPNTGRIRWSRIGLLLE